VRELAWTEVLLRLAVAAALGGAIGLERELRERQAGLRTHLLVSVGAALFALVSAYGFRDVLRSGRVVEDPTRIAAQIVSGIGFLGAGAIVRQGLSVRGLTTAATLWLVAAIGLASGAGYYSGAIVAAALVLLALWPLRLVANRLLVRVHGEERRLVVDLRAGHGFSGVLELLESLGARVESFDVEEEEGRRRVALDVDVPRGVRSLVVMRLSAIEQVLGARWGR
jgi:putative Mg2+ transporter-C (MgtC) family protein